MTHRKKNENVMRNKSTLFRNLNLSLPLTIEVSLKMCIIKSDLCKLFFYLLILHSDLCNVQTCIHKS